MEEYLKKFVTWTKLKVRLHLSKTKIYFKEREIWWASLGANIGYEQNGKHETFERPVLILKIFNRHILWIVPLTRSEKDGNKYYFQLEQNGEDSFVILSQLKVISSKRLFRKMRTIRWNEFKEIKKRIIGFLL